MAERIPSDLPHFQEEVDKLREKYAAQGGLEYFLRKAFHAAHDLSESVCGSSLCEQNKQPANNSKNDSSPSTSSQHK